MMHPLREELSSIMGEAYFRFEYDLARPYCKDETSTLNRVKSTWQNIAKWKQSKQKESKIFDTDTYLLQEEKEALDRFKKRFSNVNPRSYFFSRLLFIRTALKILSLLEHGKLEGHTKKTKDLNELDASLSFFCHDTQIIVKLKRFYRSENRSKKVFEAVNLTTGERKAITQVLKKFGRTEFDLPAQIHSSICPSLIPPYDFIIPVSKWYFALGQLYNGNASHALTTFPSRVAAIKAALLGEMYLQSMGLTHHDIKPANLLKESDEKWVLADYGHLCALGAFLPCEGTHHYASPQTLKGYSPTPKDAVWEISTTALEILGSRYLSGKLVDQKVDRKLDQRSMDEFYARQERAIFRSRAYGLEDFFKRIVLFKLFLSCIRVNPAERLDLNTLYNAFASILAKNDDEALEEALSLNKTELRRVKELMLWNGVLNVYKDFLEAKRLSASRLSSTGLNPLELLDIYYAKHAVWRSGVLWCEQDRLDFEAFKKLYIQPCPLPIPLDYPFLMTALTTWKYIQSPDCPFYIKKRAGNSIQSYSVVIQPKEETKQVWFCTHPIYKRKGVKSVYKALNLSTFQWMAVTKISGERAEFERSFPNNVKTGDCPDLVPDYVFSFDVNKFNGSTKKAMGLGELYTGTLVNAPLPLSSHLKAMLTLLRGEKYLIDRGWTQGDLKPTNIFIRQDGRYLLGDFGLACRLGEPRRSGTNQFAGPEVFQNAPASEADSSWQAGATGLSLLGLNLNTHNFVNEKITRDLTPHFVSVYFESLIADLVDTYLNDDHKTVLELFNLYKSCHDLTPSKRPKLSDMIKQLSLMEQKLK